MPPTLPQVDYLMANGRNIFGGERRSRNNFSNLLLTSVDKLLRAIFQEAKMSTMEHMDGMDDMTDMAGMDHGNSADHGSHSGHAGHMNHAAMFKRLFWYAVILAIPTIALDPGHGDVLVDRNAVPQGGSGRNLLS
jgi:hypothetical protein